jgi:hypothetical protein
MTTQLENLLISSIKIAQKQYGEMTGGYALWHAPESFVQMVTAKEIYKELGVIVYPECTPDQFSRDSNKVVKLGRPPKINEQQRFDLVTWWKKKSQPRALIELKLTYASMASVLKDADKLYAFRKEALRTKGLRHGYLLVYNSAYRNTEIKKVRQGKQTITDRFDATTEALKNKGFKLVKAWISPEKRHFPTDTQVFAHGVALWRIDFLNTP